MKNIAIIGANGAIGSAFVQLFSNDENVRKIYACSRSKNTVSSSKIISLYIDVTKEASIKTLAESIDEELDLIIVASGILHQGQTQPEKALKDLSLENCHNIFSVNTFGPMIITKYLLPKLNKKTKSVLAILSARVGSISDNKLGGWYTYRASKTALNMFIKTASIELKRLNKYAIILGLHPGTVDSQLSRPFQARVPEGKLFTPQYSVEKLFEVINQADTSDSGECYDFNNLRIDY